MLARRPFLRAALALAALAAADALAGQDAAATLDKSRAVVASLVEGDGSREEAGQFAEALAVALVRAADAAGFSVTREDAPPRARAGEASDPELAISLAASTGARWIMIAAAGVQDSRALWRASVYDGSSGAVVGSDSFSAYAGLSALAFIEVSAEKAIESALAAISASDAPEPVLVGLSFASPDGGARVGAGETLFGEIADGRLDAPYFPFIEGSELSVRIEKEGYWPRTQSIRVSGNAEDIQLKPLYRATRVAYGANYGTARILGAAGFFRKYLIPDQVYAKAEFSLWAAYDFSAASRPVLHDELRLGMGAYLFFDPMARFRVSVGTGVSSIGTFLTAKYAEPRLGLDICVEPVFFTLEWHWPEWAIVLESRYPYSLGADTGFLKRGWLSLGDAGPQFLSVGVLFKR